MPGSHRPEQGTISSLGPQCSHLKALGYSVVRLAWMDAGALLTYVWQPSIGIRLIKEQQERGHLRE